jgi:hypothetical protein
LGGRANLGGKYRRRNTAGDHGHLSERWKESWVLPMRRKRLCQAGVGGNVSGERRRVHRVPPRSSFICSHFKGVAGVREHIFLFQGSW